MKDIGFLILLFVTLLLVTPKAERDVAIRSMIASVSVITSTAGISTLLNTTTFGPVAASSDTSLASLPATCRLGAGNLPDPICTPGSIDPRVTQANIHQTVCVSGYTRTVRPSTSYTTPLKVQLIARYGLTDPLTSFELDHLVPLALGGAPKDVHNLFPQYYAPTPGAHEKDALENKLHSAVCNGQMTLAHAQGLFANNWIDAYTRYVR